VFAFTEHGLMLRWIRWGWLQCT